MPDRMSLIFKAHFPSGTWFDNFATPKSGQSSILFSSLQNYNDQTGPHQTGTQPMTVPSMVTQSMTVPGTLSPELAIGLLDVIIHTGHQEFIGMDFCRSRICSGVRISGSYKRAGMFEHVAPTLILLA